MKQCGTCKKYLPASADYFGRDRRKKDGLCNECKACRSLYQAKWREENAEHKREYDKAYRAKNKERIKARDRKYYRENKQRILRRQREYARRHQKRIREYQRQYAQEWRKQHPIEHRAKQHRRRALKRGANGKHSAEDIKRQYNVQNGKCWWCLEPVGETFHVDHLIPLSRGGHNGPSNLVVACEACNLKKGAKTPAEFMNRLF